MTIEPDWTLCRSFLAVLREGSLSGAARVLRLAQPTLGRHVAALEEALGQALFTRSPAGLVPTPTAVAIIGSVFSSLYIRSLDAAGGVYGSLSPELQISGQDVDGVLAALLRAIPAPR